MQRPSSKRISFQGNAPGEASLKESSGGRGGGDLLRQGGDSCASSIGASDSGASLGAASQQKSAKTGFSKISSQVLSNTSRESFKREEGAGRGLIHPRDPRYMIFWYISMGTAAWSAILDPYSAAFTSGAGITTVEPFWRVNSIITTVLFFVDIALKFNLGFVDPFTGNIEWSRKVIAWNYFKDKFFLDVLFTFPFTGVIISAMGGVNNIDASTAVYITILQFLKTGRLYRMFDMFTMLEHNMVLSQLAMVLVRNTIYILFTCHWFACTLYIIGHLEMLIDEPSWLSRHYERIDGQPTFVLYIYSLYLSVSAFANVGDNEFYMATPAESIAMICYLFFNIVLGAYILGTITMLVVKGDELSKAFRDRVTDLRDFSSLNALSTDLAASMRTQLELYYTRNHISDENVLGVFPVAIKRKVLRHLYLDAVSKCYVFGGAKSKFLDVLIGACRVEIFMPEIQVLMNGDHVYDLAVIMDGEVEVVPGAGRRTASFNGGKSGGSSMKLFAGSNRSTFRVGTGNSDSSVSSSAASGRRSNAILAAKDLRGVSATYGELAFFTEGESAEGVWTTSVVNTLVLSRIDYLALAGKFPSMANKIFDNLKAKSSQGMLKTLYDAVYAADTASPNDLELMDKLLADADDMPFQIDAMDPKELASIESFLTPEEHAHLSKLRFINDQIVRYCNNESHRMSAEMLSASSEGDLAKIRFLHAQGVSVDTADYDMRTPLMVAASTGRKEAIELLLSLGADTQIVDNFGESVMYEAVNKGYESIVDILTLHGATLAISHRLELHHLTSCIVSGDCARLAHFLHAGANPDNRSPDLRTVLHLACAWGNLQAVMLLVEDAEANPELKDVWGITPLMEAKRVGAIPVIRFLEDQLEVRKKLRTEKEAAEKLARPGVGAVLATSASGRTLGLPLPLPAESSETDSDADDGGDDGDYPVYVGAYFQLTPEMREVAEGAAAAAELPVSAPAPVQLIGGVESSRCPSTNGLLSLRSSSPYPARSSRAIPSDPSPGLMVNTAGVARDRPSPVGSPFGRHLTSSLFGGQASLERPPLTGSNLFPHISAPDA